MFTNDNCHNCSQITNGRFYTIYTFYTVKIHLCTSAEELATKHTKSTKVSDEFRSKQDGKEYRHCNPYHRQNNWQPITTLRFYGQVLAAGENHQKENSCVSALLRITPYSSSKTIRPIWINMLPCPYRHPIVRLDNASDTGPFRTGTKDITSLYSQLITPLSMSSFMCFPFLSFK